MPEKQVYRERAPAPEHTRQGHVPESERDIEAREYREGGTTRTTPESQEQATRDHFSRTATASTTQGVSDPELRSIETILAEGMEEFFLSLPPQQQLSFKATGEATAVKIRDLIHRGSYRVKDIVQLIVNWLKSLPGINKFFLEQEAKIKADKIVDRYMR